MFKRKPHYLTGIVAFMLAVTPLFAVHKVEEASVLLQRIESNAMGARYHAAKLKTFTAQPTLHPWQIHTAELQQVKAQVNEIAELLGDFKEIKAHASMRQMKAFNALLPEAVKTSDLVEKAIQIVNNEREKLEVAHPDYENTVEGIYDGADRVVAAVGFAESWEEVKEARKEFRADRR